MFILYPDMWQLAWILAESKSCYDPRTNVFRLDQMKIIKKCSKLIYLLYVRSFLLSNSNQLGLKYQVHVYFTILLQKLFEQRTIIYWCWLTNSNINQTQTMSNVVCACLHATYFNFPLVLGSISCVSLHIFFASYSSLVCVCFFFVQFADSFSPVMTL